MKKSLIFSLVIVAVLFLTGCEKIQSVIYKVETGDSIKVKVKSDDDYSFNFDDDDNTMTFKKDGKKVAIAKFLTKDSYDEQMENLELYKDTDYVQLLGEGQKDNNKYVFFAVVKAEDYIEYNYLFMIKGTKTAFILGGYNNQKDVENLFKVLSVTEV